MILIDLSSHRRFIETTAKDIRFTLSLNEDKTNKLKIAVLGTLTALFSINNTTSAESLKNSTSFIDNHLYPNLLALCEIIKQTNYTKISLAIEKIKMNSR